MENINYSLQEYFEKKYPKQKYKVKCYDGSICEELCLRNKVQHWLETNSGEINFKIGKELYDILM